MAVHLPVIKDGGGSIRGDGSRVKIVTADVSGRFDRLRRVGFAVLVALYVALPLIRIDGKPAILIDIPRRELFLFGASFNAQDTWLSFFLLSGIGFALISLAALVGRVWCGYACPQTVFIDGLIRPIERLFEGPRNQRLKRDAGPPTLQRIARKLAKHVVFGMVAFAIAHMMLAYFVSLPGVFAFVSGAPGEHMTAFAWMAALTAILYFDFAWFREQLCVVICPYGRLQAALADEDSITVGYDERRGEARGKGKERAGLGDCVDCFRCVHVCPTGIDIRNGQQLDCIGCTACIDACDDVMKTVGKPTGLVRYDSLRGLHGEKRRFMRPRVVLYAILGACGVLASSVAFASRVPFEANVLRPAGAPYMLVEGVVRNAYQVHLANKRSGARTFELALAAPSGATASFASTRVELGAMEERHVPLFVTLPESAQRGALEVEVVVTMTGGNEPPQRRVVTGRFLGPRR